MVAPVNVVSRREFAGSWEYLVDDAIFTSPPHPAWSGSALISREGKLVGVGSLIVGDATGENEPSPGNMFVPIDLLLPIMADLSANGRVSGPGKPWLGVNAQAAAGKLVVGRVTPESPAGEGRLEARRRHRRRRRREDQYAAGVLPASCGRRATPAWWCRSTSSPAAAAARRIDVPSVNRLDQLKLQSTF